MTTNGNSLTTGNGDPQAYVFDGGNGLCFPTIGNPVGFPFSCDSSQQGSTVGTAGDDSYIAIVNGTVLHVLDVPPASTFTPESSFATTAGSIPVFYTR